MSKFGFTLVVSLCLGFLASSAFSMANARDSTTESQARQQILSLLRKVTTQAMGSRRGDYFVPDSLVRDTIYQGVEFAGDDHSVSTSLPSLLPPNEQFLSGCRLHSCDEKAAAILDVHASRLLAAALRHFHCHMVLLDDAHAKAFGDRHTSDRSPTQCDTQATLTIYVLRSPPPARPDFAAENARVEQLRKWARLAGYTTEEVRVIESGTR